MKTGNEVPRPIGAIPISIFQFPYSIFHIPILRGEVLAIAIIIAECSCGTIIFMRPAAVQIFTGAK